MLNRISQSPARGLVVRASFAALFVFLGACDRAPSPVIYPVLSLREEMRIRTPSPGVGRADIVGAAIDGAGNIYLMDASERRIFVHDSAGNFLNAIGGMGVSEGQFHMLGSLGIIGDTVWVSDPRLGRITSFRRDGTVIATTDHFAELNIPGIKRYSLLGLLPEGGKLIGLEPVLDPSTSDDFMVPFLAVSSGGTVDTMFNLPIPATYTLVPGLGDAAMVRPYDGRPVIGVKRDGSAWVVVEREGGESGPANAVLTRYSLAAGKEWTGEVPVTPLRIPDRVADSIVSTTTSADNQATHLREWLRLPTRFPLVSSAMLSDDDSIWLKEATVTDVSRWIRLTASGQPNGAVSLLNDSALLSATADRIWVLEFDTAGAPSVARYAIR